MAAPTFIDLPNDIFTVIGRFVPLTVLRMTCRRFAVAHRRYNILPSGRPPTQLLRLHDSSTLTITIFPADGRIDYDPEAWMRWLAKHFAPGNNHHLVVKAHRDYQLYRHGYKLALRLPQYRPASLKTEISLLYVCQFVQLPEVLIGRPQILFHCQSTLFAKSLHLKLQNGTSTDHAIICNDLYVTARSLNTMLCNNIYTSARIHVTPDDSIASHYLETYMSHSQLRSLTIEVSGCTDKLFKHVSRTFAISSTGTTYTISYIDQH